MSPSSQNTFLKWVIIIMCGVAIYYIFFDKTPKSVGDDLDQPPAWCSGIYCD